MTTLDGSATDAGSLDAAEGGSDTGSNPSASNFLSGLDRDSREWINANGISDDDPAEILSGLITKSREMESLIGRSVRFPAEDASAEEVDTFYDRLTARLRPEDAAGYEYSLPEGLPQDMPYDSEFADAWRQFSHDAKLPAHVSAKAHDWFLQHAATAIQARQTENNALFERLADDSTKAIQEVWGPQGSRRYATNREHFSKAIDGLGGETLMSELVDAGVIDEDQRILAPRIVMALAKAGEAMFAEDQLVSGGAASRNPFSDESRNWDEQNSIIRDDPTLARQLIQSAGKDPKTYRL